MDDSRQPPKKPGWAGKFAAAGTGIGQSLRRESSFHVHVPVALLVLALAIFLGLPTVELCLLLLCITIVFATELLNTAIEHLARAVDTQFNPQIRQALDVGSGAVLAAACGASTVGLLILGSAIGARIGWW
jgi:diacylglycerol kinase